MPQGWQDFISDQDNRKALVAYLSSAFCKIASVTLKEGESLVVTSGLENGMM